METRGKPASRLHAIDRKSNLSGGFGPLWPERMHTNGPCTFRLGKGLGTLEWPKTWGGDSRQACESLARDRSQT